MGYKDAPDSNKIPNQLEALHKDIFYGNMSQEQT